MQYCRLDSYSMKQIQPILQCADCLTLFFTGYVTAEPEMSLRKSEAMVGSESAEFLSDFYTGASLQERCTMFIGKFTVCPTVFRKHLYHFFRRQIYKITRPYAWFHIDSP
jgi:hypothetical protein